MHFHINPKLSSSDPTCFTYLPTSRKVPLLFIPSSSKFFAKNKMSDPNLTSPSSHQITPYPFPIKHTYPPLFSFQPTLITRHAQLETWSRIIQSYCRHYRLHKLVLATALDSPLFHSQQLKKRIGGPHLRELVKFMVSEGRAEWIGGEKNGGAFWVWWKRPEEWAEVLAGWVCHILFSPSYITCTMWNMKSEKRNR